MNDTLRDVDDAAVFDAVHEAGADGIPLREVVVKTGLPGHLAARALRRLARRGRIEVAYETRHYPNWVARPERRTP